MAIGAITEWDDGFGQGLISEDGDGVHAVYRQDCTAALQAQLSARTIPPGSVAVTFDLAVDNKAINVDVRPRVAFGKGEEADDVSRPTSTRRRRSESSASSPNPVPARATHE